MARQRDEDDDYDDDDRPRRSKKKSALLPPDTPTVYVHEKCDGETEMPVEEIRKYLKNPFDLGEDPTTYCSECDKNVSWKKCFWADTEQNMYEYLDDLRGEMVVSGRDPRGDIDWAWWLPLIGAVGAGLAFGVGSKNNPGWGLAAGLIAAVVGGLAGAGYMWFERDRAIKATAEWNDKLVKRYYRRHPEAKKAGKAKRRRSDDDD